MTTKIVTDEQLGRLSRRYRGVQEKMEKGAVSYDLLMSALQAVADKDQSHLIDLVGPVYPMGTIALSLEIDLSLSLEEMIRRGKYSNEQEALQEITEERFPINRDVPELRYPTTVLLIPPYCEAISFKDQEAEMKANRLQQLGVAETLAIGERYPLLQYAYFIMGLASSWRDSDGSLSSPELWQYDGKRKLNLSRRFPESQLHAYARCVALPQAGT